MKNLFFALFAVLAIGFVSCGGDDCSLESMAADAQEYNDLGTTYFQDTTSTADCEAYQSALESFISDYEDCDDVTIAGQVTLTRAALEALDCQ